jgi:hypothetical protein
VDLRHRDQSFDFRGQFHTLNSTGRDKDGGDDRGTKLAFFFSYGAVAQRGPWLSHS